MKKFSVLFSVLLIAAVVLSACGGANNNNNDLETPGAFETPGTVIETPMDSDLVATPTLAVTDVIETTPTTVLETTPETDLTGTPQAEVPVTGDNDDCNPYLMTAVLDYEVFDSQDNVIGDVDAIVVYRDAAEELGGGAVVADDTLDATPVAGATVDPNTTVVPGGVDVTTIQAGSFAAPRIAYVIVDLDDAGNIGDKDVLVPFTYFGGPATADEDIADCDFIVSGELSDLEQASNMDDNAWPDFYVEDWDSDIRTYWSGLGVDVDFVGPNGGMLGNPVIFREEFDDIDVENVEGEDIGEIEDFVIDPNTGDFQYAILAAGGFLGLGETLVPVPMDNILWGNFDDDMDDLGEIVINIPADAWQNAPSLDNLSDVDFTDDTWHADVDTFWVDYRSEPVQ